MTTDYAQETEEGAYLTDAQRAAREGVLVVQTDFGPIAIPLDREQVTLDGLRDTWEHGGYNPILGVWLVPVVGAPVEVAVETIGANDYDESDYARPEVVLSIASDFELVRFGYRIDGRS